MVICEEHSLHCPSAPVQPSRAPLYAEHRGDRREAGEDARGKAHAYQALDSSAIPVRDAKRRGHGWLAGEADIGWSNSIGWYEGFSVLAAIEPSHGVITGFCFGSASTADQPLAETFFAVRANPNPRLLSVGAAFSGIYVADKGFEGTEIHRRWQECYGAECRPSSRAQHLKKPWSKGLRQWVAFLLRQIVETVYDKLFNAFGLWRESPHEIGGFAGAFGSKVGSAQLLYLAQ